MPTVEPATFSPDRLYRYTLQRRVSLDPGICAFCMLNPSTADEEQDDPTIRRCMGFARAWGYGTLLVVNLFALRATDPRALKEAIYPVGPNNNQAIRDAVGRADRFVMAWGNGGTLYGRADTVRVLINLSQHVVYDLGTTKAGEPRHPLYIPKSQAPVPCPR